MVKRWAFYGAVSFLVILFFIFGLFNRAVVEVDYILWTVRWPLIFVMLFSFVFGALLTLVVFAVRLWFWRSRALAYEKLLQEHELLVAKSKAKKEFDEANS